MEKKYRATLTDEERAEMGAMVSSGKSNARKLVRARILLLADQTEGGSAKSDPEIVDALDVDGRPWNEFDSNSSKWDWRKLWNHLRQHAFTKGNWTAEPKLIW